MFGALFRNHLRNGCVLVKGCAFPVSFLIPTELECSQKKAVFLPSPIAFIRLIHFGLDIWGLFTGFHVA